MTEDDQVRRLLADARHTEPVPDDVAARLDGALADLRADRPVRPTITDLAAARRRRRARTMLIAAAAVVVLGVGIGQVGGLQAGDDSDSPNASTADSADAGAGGDAERAERDGPAAEEDAAGADAPVQEFQTASGAGPARRITSEDFGRAALRLRAQRTELQRYSALGGDMSADRADKQGCTTGSWGAGHAVRVRYDGSPAVLVYRPPRGDTQVVDLFLCGTDEPSRSITLTSP